MKYTDLKTGIRDHLNNAAEDFFMVGYYLRQISENTLFIEDGYKSIWEFAKGEYGLSTSSASRFMAINARFSIDGGEHMDQKYIGMGPSKLQEMLGLSDEDLEKVTQETTVKELRAIKARKVLQKEITCEVSGEACDRKCEAVFLDIESGMYKAECLHLHPELAGENTACCLNCKYKGLCFSSCDVAKKKHQEEVKENQKRLQKEQAAKEKEKREAAERAAAEAARKAEEEARAKQEPTEAEIKKLFDHWDLGYSQDPDRDLDPKNLKKEHRWESLLTGEFSFSGADNGVTINGKKRLTWLKLSKALTEVFNSIQPGEESSEPEQEEKEPEIIDAEFTEVEEAEQEAESFTPAEEEPVDVIEAEPDPEEYDLEDVKELLEKYERDLKSLRGTGFKKPLKKTRLIADALKALLKQKEAGVID